MQLTARSGQSHAVGGCTFIRWPSVSVDSFNECGKPSGLSESILGPCPNYMKLFCYWSSSSEHGLQVTFLSVRCVKHASFAPLALEDCKTDCLNVDPVLRLLSLNRCGHSYSAPYDWKNANPGTRPVQRENRSGGSLSIFLTRACMGNAQMTTALGVNVRLKQAIRKNNYMFP